MSYSDDKVIFTDYKITGNTIGTAVDLGYDIGVSENLSLGVQISAITGTLFKYDWNDGSSTETIKLEEGEYESLNRVDLSIGLRYSK